MTKNDASARAVALVNEAIDVLLRASRAPESPVSAFVSKKMRREFRRDAVRLRAGKARPLYPNLHSAETLAGVYERTVQRDEIIEQALDELRRITYQLDALLKESLPEIKPALEAMILDASRAATEQGPGSEAAERFQQMLLLTFFGRRSGSQRRRRKPPAGGVLSLASDPSVEARMQLSAATPLTSPPSPDETVIAIPPEEEGSGRDRVWLRIGLGESSWIGSFECGDQSVSTATLMPDNRHLFVSVLGAGYIIDAQTRTLVATIGTQVAGTMSNEPRTLFIVNHNDTTLEAFGPTGRLWKTPCISLGVFRHLALTDHALIGKCRPPGRVGWARFAVDLRTGEVWLSPPGNDATSSCT